MGREMVRERGQCNAARICRKFCKILAPDGDAYGARGDRRSVLEGLAYLR
jgi:hypothetical protein